MPDPADLLLTCALTAHMKRACQVFAVPAPGLWLFSNGCPGLRGAGAGVLVCARALIAARGVRAADRVLGRGALAQRRRRRPGRGLLRAGDRRQGVGGGRGWLGWRTGAAWRLPPLPLSYARVGTAGRCFAGWCPLLRTRVAGAVTAVTGIVPAAASVPVRHGIGGGHGGSAGHLGPDEPACSRDRPSLLSRAAGHPWHGAGRPP